MDMNERLIDLRAHTIRTPVVAANGRVMCVDFTRASILDDLVAELALVCSDGADLDAVAATLLAIAWEVDSPTRYLSEQGSGAR